ncbi:phage tail length tape measure family protein [Brevundimonas sp.]|uniref:phage tail length tape measure family protein n=1 Tax=Brevundimonas sp. TaxID=1871086 RepID=UPI002D3C1A05|nr:phage tail length tape measure family protein [Brevundimonas sp.]HYD29189.1 phage tail length tape measure family protein [Brevundimonas sp.]
MTQRRVDLVYALSGDADVKRRLDALGAAGDAAARKVLGEDVQARATGAIAKATAELAATQKRIAAAVADGRMEQEKANRVLAGAEERYRRAVAAANAMGGAAAGAGRQTKLAAHEVTNLTYQLQDAAVQLAGGQNPFLILMQQGPQASAAVGGVGRALSLLATPTGAAVAGFAAIGGAAALVGTRIAGIASETRALSTQLATLNPQLDTTAERLRRMAAEVAQQGAGTRTEVMGAIRAIVSNRGVRDEATVRDLASLAPDMEGVLGQKVEDVATKLAAAYAKGAAGIEKLDEELGFLTRDQLESIRTFDEQGRRVEALAVATAALKERFGGAAQAMRSEWGNAFHDLSTAWDAFLERLGSSDAAKRVAAAAASAARGWKAALAPTPEQEIVGVGREIADKRRELADLQGSGSSRMAGRITALQAQIADLEAREAALIEEQRRLSRAMDAQKPGFAPGGGRPRSRGPDAMTEDEAKRLDGVSKANERYFKALAAVGAERQVLMAGAQAWEDSFRRGESLAARNEAAAIAETRARRELGAAIADQSAQLSVQARGALAVGAAWLTSAAAAARADAERQAALEALTSGVDAAARAQEILTERAAKAVEAGGQQAHGLTLAAEAQERLAAAALRGTEAQRAAELAERVRAATLEETTALETAEGEVKERLIAVIERKTAAIEREDAAQRKAAAAGMLQSQAEERATLETERRLVGATAETRARELAVLKAKQDLLRRGVSETSEEGKQILANADALAVQRSETERAQAAYAEVGRVLDQAFDRVGDAITQAFVQGEGKAVKWGNVVKGVIASIAADLFRLGAINPLRNAVLGSNAPTLWDAFSGGNAGAAGAAAGGGGANYGQILQAGQQGYNALTGTNTLGTAANGFATSSLGYSLGLSSNAVAPGTGIAAGYVDTIGAAQITNGMTLTQSGQAFTSAAGAIGYAAPYGMLGGMGGAALSNRFMNGSRVGAGVSGAVLGVGSMAAGTAAMGAMGMGAAASAAGVSGMAGATAALSAIPVYGWIAAAILAAVTAIMGASGKPSTQYSGAWNLSDVTTGQIYNEGAGGKKGTNVDGMKSAATGITQSIHEIVRGSGLTLTGGGLFVGTENATNTGPQLKLGGWDGPVVSHSADAGKMMIDALKYMEANTPADFTPGKGGKATKTITERVSDGFDEVETIGGDSEGMVTKTTMLVERFREVTRTIADAVQEIAPGIPYLHGDKFVRQAIRNTKATTAEEAVKDIGAGVQWSGIMKYTAEGYNPFSEQIKDMTAAAKDAGAAFKEQFVDLKARVLDLGLATEAEALPKLRTVFEAQLGLGKTFDSLRGVAAVTKQAEINLEAFRPTMEALGYSVAEQARLVREYTDKMIADYDRMVSGVTRGGRAAVETAIDGGYRVSSTDLLLNLGLDADAAPLASGVAAAVASVWDQLGAGEVSAAALRGVLATLDAALRAGVVSADQYNATLGALTESYRTAAAKAAEAAAAGVQLFGGVAQEALAAHRALALTPVSAVSRAYGTLGGTVSGARIAMLGAGIDPGERPALTADLTAFSAAAGAGTASGAYLAGTIERLGRAFNASRIDATQYGALVDYVTARFKTGAEALRSAAQARGATADAKRTGLLGVRATLGGGAPGFGHAMLSAGLNPEEFPDLVGRLNGFVAAARAGTATADDYAGAALRLTVALDRDRMSAEQYTTLLGELGEAYASTAAKAEETAAAMTGLGVSIRNYLTDIKTGELSVLAPDAQRAEAKAAFETALADAGKGDANAIGRLTELASTFLKASQGVYASSAGYVADYTAVTGALETFADKIEAGETPAQVTATATKLSASRLAELNTAITAARGAEITAFKDIAKADGTLSEGLSAVHGVLSTTVGNALTRLAATTENPVASPIVAAIGTLRTDALTALEAVVANTQPTALARALTAPEGALSDGGRADVMLSIGGVSVSQARRNAVARAMGYSGDFGAGGLLAFMGAHPDWARSFEAAIRVAAGGAGASLGGIGGLAGGMLGGGGSDGGGVPGFATGTPSAPAGWAWVGERGPELMRLRGGEAIMPHDASVRFAANDRGNVVAFPAARASAAEDRTAAEVRALTAAVSALAAAVESATLLDQQQRAMIAASTAAILERVATATEETARKRVPI